MLGSNTSTFGPRSGLVCARAAWLRAASPTRSIPQSRTKNGFILKNEFIIPTFRFAELYCAGNLNCSEIPLSNVDPKTIACLRSTCIVPAIDGVFLTGGWKEALWARFHAGAPQRRTRFRRAIQHSQESLRTLARRRTTLLTS